MARRPTLAVALAALAIGTPASAQPFTDVTPPDTAIVFCPADLGGGGGALAWQRYGPTSTAREVLDLAAAGLDPARPPQGLVLGGGCPKAATTTSGESLIAINLTGFTNEEGLVVVVDRSANGTTSEPLKLNDNERSSGVAAALASSGAALVAWAETTPNEETGNTTAVHVAARDAGGGFARQGTLGTNGAGPAVGIDDGGFGIVVWSEPVARTGDASRLLMATRAPGGALSAPREIGRAKGASDPYANSGSEPLSLVVSPAGEVLLAVADGSGVRVATGTTRTGIGGLRRLTGRRTDGVTAALSASGAAAVGWLELPSEDEPRPGGVAVSDRPAGGDFGVPHGLVARGTRLSGNEARNLRLAAAPDGRIVTSWAVSVNAGDGLSSAVPVAALRRADGTWEAAVSLAAACREQIGAFPGFDAAGRPRVTFVDAGLISAGDFGFPFDTRIRVAHLDAVPATPVAPPRVSISANRRQVLRSTGIKLRVRCARACDAMTFGVIGRYSGATSGLFPDWTRLRPGRWTTVRLERASYFQSTRALEREGRRVKVKLVAHACDSAGRMARARRTVFVRIPRYRPG